jgi:hypothetical protein
MEAIQEEVSDSEMQLPDFDKLGRLQGLPKGGV